MFRVDKNGFADKINFKRDFPSILHLIAQIVHGKGATKQNIFSKQQLFVGQINRLADLKSRFIRLLKDDPFFGVMLLVVNIVLIAFSWRISGSVVSFLFNLVQGEMALSHVEIGSSRSDNKSGQWNSKKID